MDRSHTLEGNPKYSRIVNVALTFIVIISFLLVMAPQAVYAQADTANLESAETGLLDTASNSSMTIIRYPISDVKLGLWREGVPGADIDNFRFNEIDDPESGHDGDATYMVTTYVKSYLAGITSPGVPDNATNISVTVVWTIRYEIEDTFHVNWPLLLVEDTFYIGPRHNVGTTYTTFSDTWTTNPATGLVWTPTSVNTVKGLGFDTNVKTAVHVTRAYLVVSYDIPAIASVDVEKYVWDGTDWADADEPTGPYILPGTDPQFRFVVTNSGIVDLENVDLTDNVYGDIWLDGTLAAGASVEYIVNGVWAAGQHTNIATVRADYQGSTFTDSDAANYYGYVPLPGLTLVKTATPTVYGSVGDIINYTYQLINTGETQLEAPFTVSDDKVSVSCLGAPSILNPGESLTCDASYTITLADLSAGSVTNTAQGHAYYVGNPVDSNFDTETVIANESQLGTTLSNCVSFRDRLIAGTSLEQYQVLYTGAETILYISGGTSYWTRFDTLSGNVFNMSVQQAMTSAYGFTKYLGVRQLPQDNVVLFDRNCRIVTGTISNLNGGTINDASFSFTLTTASALSGGPYFLLVKYDHALLVNQPIGPSYPPSGQVLAHYDFATFLDGNLISQDSSNSFAGGHGGLDLKRR